MLAFSTNISESVKVALVGLVCKLARPVLNKACALKLKKSLEVFSSECFAVFSAADGTFALV